MNIGRLYVVSPEPDDEIIERLIEAGRCGADLIQIRSKVLLPERLINTVLYIKKHLPDNVLLIVNDYPDIAIYAKADGIHGGVDDFDLKDIQEFKKKYNLIVGVSVYDSLERAKLAERYGADYVAFSSPFPSPSKKKVLTPIKVIKEAVSKLKVPVFVIGGITPENAPSMLEIGVHGIAVLSYAFRGNTCENVKKLKKAIEKYAI